MTTDIADNLKAIIDTLKQGVRLVAVSKYHPESEIMTAYNAGQRIFGESHVQELQRKHEALPKDIEWHFIGHLQTNKVKYIAPYITSIDAVDTVKLMKEINRQGEKNNRIIDILLELHVAKEETKYGFTIDECREMLKSGEWQQLNNVRICGLMTMASFVDDVNIIRQEFLSAAEFFKEAKSQFFADKPYFRECSWGMSHDYVTGMECGSTMVRVGTSIVGERDYGKH